MTKRPTTSEQRPTRGSGPLADDEPASNRPLEDPVLADHANPRWGTTSSAPPGGAQSLANADGTPNVMPPRDPQVPMPARRDRMSGTVQDQAARPLDGEVGRDNLREGRGGGTHNPELAEGGDNG